MRRRGAPKSAMNDSDFHGLEAMGPRIERTRLRSPIPSCRRLLNRVVMAFTMVLACSERGTSGNVDTV